MPLHLYILITNHTRSYGYGMLVYSDKCSTFSLVYNGYLARTQIPTRILTSQIAVLFCRAVCICSNTFLLNKQISIISKFMAWNGFPANYRSPILRKLKLKYKINEPATNSKTSSGADSNNTSDENIPKIWVRIPFLRQ